ncbi:protein kinase domain-containing protein [Microbispora hainanensis]|uniref:protein kinase domain-containing protein n=1 Tax=Microbispora hainanensis TaxID=568844 RepID=UPI00324DC9A9
MPVLRPLDPNERRRIGPYRLLGVLGEGGQGIVYLAYSDEGAKVAIKVLYPDMVDNPAARDRFLREVQAAQKVADFCTARVLDVGADANHLYVVSEFIDGDSLHRRVRLKGQLIAGELTRLGIGTAAALVAIHNAGIVHRDLKPENVILGPDGPRVVDFGIARALDGTTTQTGQIGTPPYMSPEQLRGETVGTPSDIFSWAGTMTFAATARPPFGVDNVPNIVYRIFYDEPDIEGVPHEIRDLLLRCLSKEPKERPSARDLLLSLAGPDRNSPATPTPTPTPIRISSVPISTVSTQNDRQATPGSPESRSNQPIVGRIPHLPKLSRILIAIALGVVASFLALVLFKSQNNSGPTLARGDVQVADNVFTASGGEDNGITQTISAVASSGSTVVAVGGDMTNQPPRPVFLVSVDGGREWDLGHQSVDLTSQVAPANRVVGGDGQWLAVSTASSPIAGMWTSIDGRTWTATSPTSNAPFSSNDRITDIARSAYGFVAVGATKLKDGTAGPVAWSSPDGKSWTRIGSEQIGGQDRVRGMRAVVARGDKVVALADPATGDSVSVILRSNDGGRSWLRTAAALGDVRPESGALSVTKENGFLLVQKAATGDVWVYCSPDGAQWNQCGLIGKLDAEGAGVVELTASAAGIAAVAESEPQQYGIYTSNDGRLWTRSADLGTFRGTIRDLTITDGGLLVAGGDTAGPRDLESLPVLMTAKAGQPAREVSLGALLGKFSLARGISAVVGKEHTLMTVGSSNGDAAIWTSDNSGADWKPVPLQGAAGRHNQTLTDVVRGPTGWLAVGTNMRDAIVTGPLLLTSTDGKYWKTGPNVDVPSGHVLLAPEAVTAGTKGYVMVGEDRTSSEVRSAIWFTADLKNFIQLPVERLPNGGVGVRLHDVSAMSTGFIAVGESSTKTGERGLVWLSPDGVNWRATTPAVPSGAHSSNLRRSIVSGSVIVAIGTADGRPFSAVSDDNGTSWVCSWLPTKQPAAALDLTATHRGFVAVGTERGDGAAWTSPDGREWKPHANIGRSLAGPGLQSLNAIVAIGQHVVALGRSTTSVEDHLIIWRTGLDGDPGAVPSISSPSLTAIASTAPTLRIKCVSDKCPVFVAVPGGEVLIDRDLTKNEDLTYFDKELDVVLTDASTVDVYENGKKRAKGKEGEIQSFSVARTTPKRR